MPTFKKHFLKDILSTKFSMQVVNVPQGTKNLEKDVLFSDYFLQPSIYFFHFHIKQKSQSYVGQ